MRVNNSSPAAGVVLAAPPTDFVVDFTYPYRPDTLQPGDFIVNGLPANSVDLTDSDTVTFHYANSPVTAQGLQVMHMKAGSVVNYDNSAALLGFDETFRYDAVPLEVTSTSPSPGGVISVGAAEIVFNVNEPVDPNSVGTDDLVLSQGTVTGTPVLSNGNQTMTYTLSGLTEGVFSVSLPVGAVTDAFGNAGKAFSASFDAEIAETAPAPFPSLTPIYPAGSLIYQGTANGLFNSQVPPFIAAGSGGLNRSIGLAFGPFGDLFVSSFNSDQVMRYDANGTPEPAAGQTGAVFVDTASGGLDNPEYLRVGPDGLIYVVSSTTNQVFRYNPDGSLKDIFVRSNNNGGLAHPLGLTFTGTANNWFLYVGGSSSNNVVRFNMSGQPSAFVAAGSGGLARPESLVFGSDGKLYVSSSSSNQVLRYNGTTGEFDKVFVSAGVGGLSFPCGLAFGADGTLYVSSAGTNQVLRYDANGGSLGPYVPAGAGGLSRPTDLAWEPGGLYVTTADASTVLRFDGTPGGAGDVDIYTLNLDANQTLSPARRFVGFGRPYRDPQRAWADCPVARP